MEAVFTKCLGVGRPRFSWPGGFTAEAAIHSGPRHLPHDLVHFVVDAVLRPRYGFWELAAQRAPFSSLQPNRPWPAERAAWFAKVVARHHDEMVEAERLPALLAVDAHLPLEARWHSARRLLARTWSSWPSNPRPDLTLAAFGEMLARHRHLGEQWHALPFGDVLAVSWPPAPVSLEVWSRDGEAAERRPERWLTRRKPL